MRNKSMIIMAVLVPACVVLHDSASAVDSNAGTAAYTFLKIGSGAKAQALGGAFVGLADDATALFYNPAGITARGESAEMFDELLNKPVIETPPNRFAASYINYLLDFQYGFIGYVRELDSTTSLGASVLYQNYGTFNRLDREGTLLGTFGASDLAFGITYSRRLSPRISFGLTGKYIYEKIEEFSSSGMAADVGLMYLLNPDGNSRIGLALTNFGAQLKGLTESHKDNLPTKVAMGISHRLVGLPLVFSGEAGKPFDNSFYGSLGAEFISLKPFFLRLGWTSQGRDYRLGNDNDYLAGFAGGFGLEYKSYHIDYSYSSYADLGSVHRISVDAGF
jgi:hypothetical protein